METSKIPAISVVMSVYNGEKYLEKGISSIVNQTFTDWELIVCDDGSADNTYELLKQFAQRDERIRVIRNEHNSGLAYSLNRAISIARSNILARQDADDESAPNRFEVQYPYVIEHPEYAIVGTAWYNVSDERQWVTLPLEEPTAMQMLWVGSFMHPSWMMRKDQLEKVGFYTAGKYTMRDQDYHLAMKLLGAGMKMYNMQTPLYYYTNDSSTFNRTKNWKRVKGLMWIRFDSYKRNHFPIWAYVAVLKPLVKNLLPAALTKAYYFRKEQK